MKRKVVFKADCIGKTISIFPSLKIYANCAKAGANGPSSWDGCAGMLDLKS